ncbi:MAG: LysR substrate-binding domain-containing protein [Litoreibacter sp.]|nr:LysR substrate-binding domain-containing protein [Litoreibacter sp.]MCY4334025.1 LysR substrate-binding domain-containing protein [Litoreibacter sp.]
MVSFAQTNLSALRAVEAVARLGSLRLAASELGVTPGAVSQQIIKAEAQLDRKLFDRTSKGLLLTQTGKDLAASLTEGFAALARGVASAQSTLEDTITVSVAPVFAAKWLVRRLGRFADLRPDIRVRIDASAMNVSPVPGDIDACIRVGRGDWPGLKVEEILPQHVFPVCAPSVSERLIEIDDLACVPIIRERKNQLFGWDTWLGPNDASDAVLGDGPVFSDASLCLDAAAAGQGVFLALETLAQDAIATGQLVQALPGRFRSDISYWFVEPLGSRRQPQVKAFRDWIREEMQA